jgi:tetratricopeptide (TPR) repeat protein
VPGNAEFLDSRGFTYLKMRQWRQAIADYEAALKVDPKRASALFGRGVGRYQMGYVPGGKADVAAAIAIDSSIFDELTRRGLVVP